MPAPFRVIPIAEAHFAGFYECIDEAARERGYTRVELTVRADNLRAKSLYEACGFGVEGLCRNHMLIDGKYYDSYLMALLFE